MKTQEQIQKLEGKKRWTFQWLVRTTESQRDRYYQSVMKFERDSRTEKVARFFELTGKLPSDESNKETYRYDRKNITPENRQEERVYDAAKWADDEMSRITTIQYISLKEAEDFFNGKILGILNKLEGFDLLKPEISLTTENLEVSDEGVDFWIEARSTIIADRNRSRYERGNSTENRVGRVHARMIWVNCYEKASHWRFITTLKK